MGMMTSKHERPAKPSYLFVVASSCQMYSGTGTAIFDWIRFARDEFDFSILMDVEDPTNFGITRRFCDEHGIPLHASRGLKLPGCADTGVRDVAARLSRQTYDFIECVSWANAATNLSVLASRQPATVLVYVPHSQPLWTLPEHERYFMTAPAFRRMQQEADLVFLDTASESRLLDVDRAGVTVVPLGVDTVRYVPATGPVEPHTLLCVCDCREKRKRLDLLVAAFAIAHATDPRLRLVVGGRGSADLPLPAGIAHAVRKVGYVSHDELVRLYQTASLFVLLTDYEAFGLPIAESLCCGCPVLLNRLDVLVDAFADLEGVSFVDNRDLAATAVAMRMLADQPVDRGAISVAAAARFSFEHTYGRKQSIILGHASRSEHQP